MASTKNPINNREFASDIKFSASVSKDSLSIRTKTNPTPERPVPLTASSCSSGSSASSNESLEEIFDNDALQNRPESPTTPPESIDCLGNSIVLAAEVTNHEDTPVQKARRRPGRPRLSTTQDRQHLSNKRYPSVRVGPKQINPPPKLKQLTLKETRDELLRAAESRPAIIGDDIFAVSDLNQAKPRKRAAPHASDKESNEDRPDDTDEHIPETSREHISEHKLQEDGGMEEEDPPQFDRYNPRTRNVRSINEEIKKIMEKPKVPNPSSGWTYIMASARAPGYLKIGNTMRMNDRDKALKKCEPGFTQIDFFDMNAFDHHSVVESLVHQELYNARKKLYCSYHKYSHDEWFQVEKEDALKSINRWRAWVEVQKPYQTYQVISNKPKPGTVVKQWKLSPYWRWKVNNLPKIIADVDWDIWIRPSRLDYWDYWYEEHWGDYYLTIKTHLMRKDKHFILVGGLMFLAMHILFGGACSTCTLICLIFI
ncbi:hypothetical protein EG329_005330 [Mollisiaceae sp. DMI_Dod_QoI]|nr:hypothetical protein EG329_005330 [Helotiales sp. DMI_Dod_QoI]